MLRPSLGTDLRCVLFCLRSGSERQKSHHVNWVAVKKLHGKNFIYVQIYSVKKIFNPAVIPYTLAQIRCVKKVVRVLEMLRPFLGTDLRWILFCLRSGSERQKSHRVNWFGVKNLHTKIIRTCKSIA